MGKPMVVIGGTAFHADLGGPLETLEVQPLFPSHKRLGGQALTFLGVSCWWSVARRTHLPLHFHGCELWTQLPLSLGLLHGLLNLFLCIYRPCFFLVYFLLCSRRTVNKTTLNILQLHPCLKTPCSLGKVVNSSLS